MGEWGPLIGVLIIAVIIIIIVGWILLIILRGIFKGVAKVGGKIGEKTGEFVAEGATLAAGELTGERYDIDRNMQIGKKIGRGIGSAAGVIGAAALGAEFGGIDAGDSPDTFVDNSEFDNDIYGDEIDLDDDGRFDGYDTNKDGTLDTNVDGVPITGLEDVKGHSRSDGTYIEDYKRTLPDGTTSNNLRPTHTIFDANGNPISKKWYLSSSIIEQKSSLVILELTNWTGGAEYIYVRTNGSTSFETITNNDTNSLNAVFVFDSNSSSMLLVLTDSNGIVEHRSSSSTTNTATINLLFYLNQ